MRITNKYNLPQSLVNAVTVEKHNKPGCVSATTLLQGVKQILLTDRHWDELEDDVSNRIWSIHGTAVHKLLEESNPNAFTEEHFEIPVKTDTGDVLTVTGQVDLYDMENMVVTDYKNTSVWKVVFKSFDDWKKQGEIYAWLMKENGLEVRKCRFIAMLKDWKKKKAQYDETYPQLPVYVFEFDIGEEELEEGKTIAVEKANAISKAMKLSDDDIEPCTSEEMWEKKEKYAVMKKGRKSALKVCDTQEDAEEIAKERGGYVEVRKGSCDKCTGYCMCKEFCNFYKEKVRSEC